MPVPQVDYTQWGIAGAVIFTVVAFLIFLNMERRDRKDERESFLKSIQDSNKVLTDLSLRIEHCPSNERRRSNIRDNGGT